MDNVTKKLNTQPQEVLERLRFIGNLAKELGYPAYVVGGFVRDLLLGVEDYDLDIVVEGDGILFARELSKKMGVDFVTHKRFGTASLITHDKVKIDIASARKEFYECPGSLPKVSPGTIHDDVARRDFTINAMAVDISENSFGKLVDYFGGRQDLQKKVIKVLHAASFIDDPTRMLRAIRFEQRFGFSMEKQTRGLFREAASRAMLEKVHKHRLRDELILILKEHTVVGCLRRINQLYGFEFIHPQLKVSSKSYPLFKKIRELYECFIKEFPHRHKVEPWVLYLIILLKDLEPHTLQRVLSEFAFRKHETNAAVLFKKESQRILARLKKAKSASEIYRVLGVVPDEVILLVYLKARQQKIRNKITDFLFFHKGIQIHLNGEELKALGMAPGPRFKEILRELFYAKLDGKFRTKEEEINYVKHKALKWQHQKQECRDEQD
ncbi:MAG TPA: hypothetical protein DEQ77_11350 [Candidatus Omnitrophica bacterium]|nr:hypothetical protein [Candidatus Omnitrophota bacterium]